MEWKPIETAPKDGTKVLLWADGQVEIGDWLPDAHPWNDTSWWIEGGQITARNPTHWMPLPEAPNVKLRGAALLRRPSRT